MTTSRVCALFLASFFFVAASSAGESWRVRPSTEWNKKDVRRVLEHSPWAHRVKLIVARGEEATEGVPTPAERSTGRDSLSSTPNRSGRGSRVRPSVDDAPALNTARAADVTPAGQTSVAGVSVVRWASARIEREAMARDWVLRGTMTEPQARELAQLDLSTLYVVYVDLRIALRDVKLVPQGGVLTAAMAQNSFLILRHTGERVMPLGVKTAPLPEFDDRKELALAAFYIFFARQKDGKPLLPETESFVRFECPLAPVNIHVDFDLNKMARGGSPDL